MAESVVADLAAGLISKLASLAAQEVIRAWNFDKSLDTLRNKFVTIVALLHDAQTTQIAISSVQIWFHQLEDVANHTDAFMDQLAYEVTRRNMEKWDCCIPSKNTVMYRFKVARKVKSILASYDEIFKLAGDIGLRPIEHLSLTVQPRDIRNKSPYEDASLIVGRDKDILNLVQTVCINNEHDLHVVAIIGMGGQGKTTLASMVFESDDVIKMFKKKMWITVSDDFNPIKILNGMVQSLASKNLGLDNTQGLVNELQKLIKGERFLLVLDDVWNEVPQKWDELRNSLLRVGVGGAKGSSVIVTTRKQKVIVAMKTCVPYPVEKLQEDDSYELFKKVAFGDGGVSESEPFVSLGRSMVKRCGGLPLAIKALGGMLGSKESEQEWRKIQNSEIWTFQDEFLLPSLRLSYDNLPYSSLKRCFVYCSIIPKDSTIYKDELIQIWMALGFLLPSSRSDALMEDIGNEYFNILLWHSLLQDIERDEFGNIISCKMHDLVHDLALDLSKHHSLTVKTGLEPNHVSKATYLMLDNRVSDSNPTILKRNYEKVRLLYAGACVFGDVLPYIAHLTVLVLNTDGTSDKDVGEVSKSLRNMKYIKHLDISRLHCEVPDYITEFYNLQTLKVWDLKQLPKKFCKLINLRHLCITNDGTRFLINGIERLTCLQTLPHFVVSKDQNCPIGNLEGLNNLRGTVKLYGLSDVASTEEASKAKLYAKSNIQSLLLNWETEEKERVNISEQECAIDGLEPHTNLIELRIEYFMGKRLASWLTKMTNLVKLRLSDCESCEELPSLGHFPRLREMIIERMYNVRIIGINCGAAEKVITAYPSLTKLELRDLPRLEEWVEADQVFPKLEELVIKSCSKLSRMPDSCFPSLKSLTIFEFDKSKKIAEAISINLSSLTHLAITNEGGSCSLNTDPVFEGLLKSNSQSLRDLKLSCCQGLTRLTVGAALEILLVSECPDLTSIDIVEDICCLRELRIGICPSVSHISQGVSSIIERMVVDEIPRGLYSSVISFPNLMDLKLYGAGKVSSTSTLEFDDHLVSAFSALTSLVIYHQIGLKALPDTIAKLPSLEILIIWDCKDLVCLPTFHQSHSIRYLNIEACPILRERCNKGSGSECHKIQHIPFVHFT